MTDEILDRYITRNPKMRGDARHEPEAEPLDDHGSFGWLRGIRDRATMLELRKANGNILAVGYGWLEKAAFDPSDGITLFFTGQKVRIKGRNLNAEARPLVRLFEGVTRHRVPWIGEVSELDALETSPTSCVVDSIEW